MNEQHSFMLTRRTLAAGAVGTACVAVAGCADDSGVPEQPARPWEPRNPMAVPPLLDPALVGGVRTFDLTVRQGEHEYLAGRPTATYGINGDVLGPTLRMRRGERVAMAVRNTLPDLTTMHWHGMRLPAEMDGGPRQPVEPGATWTPGWLVDQPAATLWYHPHPHGESAVQVYRGLAGMILLEDETSVLPSTYGVDDFPVIIQDRTIAADGELVEDSAPTFGLMGPDITVNATMEAYLDLTAPLVRLRLLNGSNARVYHLGFDDGRDVVVVAGDQGLLEAPVRTASVTMSPAERAEILVALEPGETTTLVSRGGDDDVDAGDFQVLELRAAAALTGVPGSVGTLGGEPRMSVPDGAAHRAFKLQGHDEINGQEMDLDRIDEVVPLSALELWTVENTVYSHSFHIHGVDFTVLSVNGDPPDAAHAGRKDTVYLPPHSSVDLAVQIGPYADAGHPYMYHCHMLRHEDSGMMGQFVVVAPEDVDSTPTELPSLGHHH